MNKLQAAEQLRRALQMFALTLTDDEAMEIATVYPVWAANTKYAANTIVAWGENEVGDPQLYRCVQEHTSQEDWTPDLVPALWTPIGIAGDGVPIWSRPTGSHDAYNTDDRVHYPDKADPIYASLIDGNIWSPDEYPAGWQME